MSIEQDQPTTYQPPQYGQVGPQPQPGPPYGLPKGRKRKRKWVLPASLALAGLLVGGGVGGVIGYGEKPAPEVVEVEKVVEKEVEVPITPQVCIDALDVNQEAIELFSTFPALAGEAVKATGESDWAELNRVTAKIKTFNSDLDKLTEKVGTPVAACRLLAE